MWILYVPACIFLIIIVLLQQGKGTGFAGAFGVGPGTDAVFGPRASKSVPVKLTYISAAIFMTLALSLSIVEGRIQHGAAPELVKDVKKYSITNNKEFGAAYKDKEQSQDTSSSSSSVKTETLAPADKGSEKTTGQKKKAGEAKKSAASSAPRETAPQAAAPKAHNADRHQKK